MFGKHLDNADFPASYFTASCQSEESQRTFLWLVRGEYAMLFFASVMALDFDNSPVYYASYALILLGGLGALVVRSALKPEQKWYRSRAIAESIKTLAWRYMMQGHPYEEGQQQDRAKGLFLDSIKKIVIANHAVLRGGRIADSNTNQVTIKMARTRELSFESRMEIYFSDRIENQRNWYLKKAKLNRLALKVWTIVSIVAYIATISMAIAHITRPNWHHVPVEPLLVFASSVLGWAQVKKHSELASSYTLTAWEIGITAETLIKIKTQSDFSEFVNNAELAFSREHTQWLARQETAGA